MGLTRAEKAAEKEASAIVASLARAGTAAVEQAVKELVETLRGDPALLYHINALLHNPEWRGVLKASMSGPENGEKPEQENDSGKKVRVTIKKFWQLPRHKGGVEKQAFLWIAAIHPFQKYLHCSLRCRNTPGSAFARFPPAPTPVLHFSNQTHFFGFSKSPS